MDFAFLGLSDELLAAVGEAGYDEPTPIQRQAIPAVLQGRDVIGIAQTGTGKTAGFTLPMLDILAEGRVKARMPRSLILEPTRELAAQVAESFETYGKYHKLSMALLIGGVSMGDQDAKLDRGVDVLIATPGRLIDHFERGNVMLSGVQIAVVDECDRMLDMGFIPDVERIFKLMPQREQTLFFSATLSDEIKRLTDQFLSDPKTIEVAPPASPAETVRQYQTEVKPREKTKALKSLLGQEAVTNALIFCNRKVDVKSVAQEVKRSGFSAEQLHGDMPQSGRMEVLGRFKAGEISVLVASDVAARGLDLPRVSHVVNYDVPNNAEDYVHRIGRTGRAGRKGVAVTLVTPREGKDIADIAKELNCSIESTQTAGAPAAEGEEDEAAAGPKGRGKQRGGERQSRGRKPGRSKDGRGETGEPAEAEPSQAGADSEAEPAAAQDADSGEARPAKKRRGRRGGRSRRGGRKQDAGEANRGGDAPSEDPSAKPRQKPDAKPGRKPEKASARGGKDGKKKGGGRGGGQDEQVVGMGDHVPAFLKRPVPKRGRGGGKRAGKSESDG